MTVVMGGALPQLSDGGTTGFGSETRSVFACSHGAMTVKEWPSGGLFQQATGSASTRSPTGRGRAQIEVPAVQSCWATPSVRKAMLLTPEMSKRFRQRRFLHATLSSS